MSALKLFVLAAVVLCVHALMVEAEKNEGGRRKNVSPRRAGGRPQGGRNGPQGGKGAQSPPSKKRSMKRPRKGPGPKQGGQRRGQRPRPRGPPPRGAPRRGPGGAPRRAGRPRRIDPSHLKEVTCKRLMRIRYTDEQIEKCETNTAKQQGDSQEIYRKDVGVCLQKELGLFSESGTPIASAIKERIDGVKEMKDQKLKDELKAQVDVCAAKEFGDSARDNLDEFKECILTFCEGGEEEEEKEEETPAEE